MIFEGNNSKEVLQKSWDAIKKYGTTYSSQRGDISSIKGVTFIINSPLDSVDNYPFWDEKSDTWYQDNFVKKETNLPPEKLVSGQDIYPYKYAWRSRYYDTGIGYVKGTLATLKKLGIKKLAIKKEKDLVNLIIRTYKMIHPENLLAVLAWKGERLLNFYLENPKIIDMELSATRSDILLSIIDELKTSPNSRRAITPSFTYENIDHSGVAGGVPVYQNYQLYTQFGSKGKPEGLISFHLHRAFDAFGGAQLDFTHDREWGSLASKTLKLPLLKMVVYCNDLWFQEGTSKMDDIRKWLFFVTDAYDPKEEDIQKRLTKEIYSKKISHTFIKLKKGNK